MGESVCPPLAHLKYAPGTLVGFDSLMSAKRHRWDPVEATTVETENNGRGRTRRQRVSG